MNHLLDMKLRDLIGHPEGIVRTYAEQLLQYLILEEERVKRKNEDILKLASLSTPQAFRHQ